MDRGDHTMKEPTRLERCFEYINCQLQAPSQPAPQSAAGAAKRVITVSRQAGAGAHVVAEELVARLQLAEPKGSCPWTVFDRNLVDRVLEDHDLPGRLAKFMPEDRVSEISDTMDELFGLHPASWTLVRKTADTILRLAVLGNVILIGRGANVIAGKLDYAFHVRLVGSVERRVEHVQAYRHLGQRAAAEYVHGEDLGRKRYLKKFYGKDIDDPLLYDLVVNTDRMSYAEAARLIAEAAHIGRDEPRSVVSGVERLLTPALG